MKFFKFILIFAIFLFGAFRIYYHLTDDFHLSNITYPLPVKEQWNFPLSPSEQSDLASILDQNFYYLGKGAQVYAFGSEDGKYVIKFFKFKHLKPSILLSWIPAWGSLKELKEKNKEKKLRKLEGVFQGHLIAFEHDPHYSGLLYLHFNPTQNLPLTTHLIDKIGIEREVDLNPIVFVIQKRGETLRTVLSSLFDEGNIDLAVTRASQILDMYVAEYQKGVWDRDHGISHNTGFINAIPFHLDVGKFSYDKEQKGDFYKADLKHVAYKMEAWVKEHYPDHFNAFQTRLEAHLSQLLFAIP